MSDKSRLDRVYAQLLRHHPYGWALYKKVTKRDIFPGSCGYFDTDGDWKTLVDLNDGPGLVSQGWTSPGDGITGTKSPEAMTWGPKNSVSIQSNHVGGTVGAAIPGAPISASISTLFSTQSSHGAVLATQPPVWKSEIGSVGSAVRWMIENKRAMLQQHRDVFTKHGIWIVTKTYSTRRCAVAVMTAKSSTVEIGLEADAQGVLTLAPSSGWTSSTGSSAVEVHEDERDGLVVFISGVYFSPKVFSWGLSHTGDQGKQGGKLFRGDEDGDADDDVMLDMEFYPPLEEEEEEEDMGSELDSEGD